MQQSHTTCLFIASVILGFVSALSIPATSDNIAVETKHVLEKDNLLLVCNTTEQSDLEDFYWIKNVTARKTSTFYQFGWKLEFITILRDSSGIYSCHATNNRTGENVTLVAFKVDVQYPAQIESFALGPTVITENQTFSMECSLHANPEPVWSLMNNNTGQAVFEATLSAETQLSEIPVRCGDSGMWVCTGSNSLNNGVNVTRGSYLTVKCSPRPNPPYLNQIYEYSASLRSNITMELNITGDPVPEFTWSREDGKQFGRIVLENGARRTRLTILDVGAADFGNYTLKMTNSMGTYIAKFILKAYGYPGKPYNFSASGITYDSVDLSWTSGFDSGTKQRFQILKYSGNTFQSITSMIDGPYKNGGVGAIWNYTVTGLKSDTQYELGVLAENAENLTFSNTIVFNTTAMPHSVASTSRFPVSVAVGAGVAVVMVAAILIAFAISNRKNMRRAEDLEDKSNLTQAMKTHYGGTIVVNDGLKSPSYQNIGSTL